MLEGKHVARAQTQAPRRSARTQVRTRQDAQRQECAGAKWSREHAETVGAQQLSARLVCRLIGHRSFGATRHRIRKMEGINSSFPGTRQLANLGLLTRSTLDHHQG
jgi:hypothetical protein